MLPEIEAQIGAPLIRVVADRGYPGHNAPPDMKFKIYIAGQKRRVTEAIKRELRRRSAVEPVIGHAKAEHRMGRNFLKGAHGDAANAVLAAAGYNFRRLLAWLAAIWRALVMAVLARPARNPSSRSTTPEAQIPARAPHQNSAFFTVDSTPNCAGTAPLFSAVREAAQRVWPGTLGVAAADAYKALTIRLGPGL